MGMNGSQKDEQKSKKIHIRKLKPNPVALQGTRDSPEIAISDPLTPALHKKSKKP